MILRTGDAEAEVWLEASGDRSYCVTIRSRRNGKLGTKQFNRVSYLLFVERWDGDEGRADVPIYEAKCSTFQRAMTLGRCAAARMERKASR